MAVDGRLVQKNSKKIRSMIHLFPKQMVVDVGKLVIFGNLSDREITCLVYPTTSAHLTWSHAFEVGHMTWYLYILSITCSFTLISSLSQLVTQFKTRNMEVYIVCDVFPLSFCLSAGRVPASRSHTASNISSNPDRDKRPTWEKTWPSKIPYLPTPPFG